MTDDDAKEPTTDTFHYYIKPTFENAAISSINSRAVQKWVSSLVNEDYDSDAVRLAFAVFRGAVRYALDHEMLLKNPLAAVEGGNGFKHLCSLLFKTSQSFNQGLKIVRRLRFEVHRPLVQRVLKGKAMGVQRLPREFDPGFWRGIVNILFLSHQRMAARSGLNANLVAFAGDQRDLDQSRS